MHHFAYRDGLLHAEAVNLRDIAEAVGTPTYVYAAATLRRHLDVFLDAFEGTRALVAYSVKANPNLAVIATLARRGAGADVVSEGELRKALKAGVPPQKIVFSGVGKTQREIAFALKAGIGLFNVESEPELATLNAIAQEMGLRAPVALRLNPDVAAGGHAKISTGKAEDKFGVPWNEAERVYAHAAGLSSIDMQGLDVHIGSQITEVAPFEAAAKRVKAMAIRLRTVGLSVQRIDMGGGLGIPYGDIPGAPALPSVYAAALRRILDPLDVEIIVEPGRLIAGNAGVLLTRVIYVKDGAAKTFVIVDAAMNDLLRPALYGAWHDIKPVREPRANAPMRSVDVVGPVCETGDAFAADRPLPPLASGDLAVVMSAGAYGAAQASEYNARPRAAEVLVDGGGWFVARPRASYEAMMAAERMPMDVSAARP